MQDKTPLYDGLVVSRLIVAGMVVGSLLLNACSKNIQKDANTATQLSILLSNHKSACAPSLLAVGQDLIGDKQHGLQLLDNAKYSINNNESVDNNDGDKTKKTAKNIRLQTDNISMVGTLVYNDRPSHIRMDANLVLPAKNASDPAEHCQVTYQLNYVLDESCFVMRENAFKKWIHQQDINENTSVYRHKRKAYQTAFLTKIDRNRKCLINMTSSQIKPIKTEQTGQ